MELKNKNLVYCFTKKTLDLALKNWADEAIKAYPDKESDIRLTSTSVMDFMTSEHVLKAGMLVEQLLNEEIR